MKFLVTLLLLIFIISFFKQGQADMILVTEEEWENYKLEFNKKYESPELDRAHLQAYIMSKKTIQEHNKKFEEGIVSYNLGLNQFSDLLPDEKLFSKKPIRRRKPRPSRRRYEQSEESLPFL